MANVQITQLPAAEPLTGYEAVPVVQNGITVRTTTGAIAQAPILNQTFLTVNQEVLLRFCPVLPSSFLPKLLVHFCGNHQLLYLGF